MHKCESLMRDDLIKRRQQTKRQNVIIAVLFAFAGLGSAAYGANAAGSDAFWNDVDPIGVLERMTYLKGDKG